MLRRPLKVDQDRVRSDAEMPRFRQRIKNRVPHRAGVSKRRPLACFQKGRRFIISLVIISVFVVSVIFVLISSSSRQHAASSLRLSSNNPSHHKQHFNSLCDIRVCSHQLLNAPKTDGLLPKDGSIQAMDALWQAGIHCFDIDSVTLKDGTLLAAHPKRFAAAVETNSIHDATAPEEFTLKEARNAGVDEIGFPLLKDALIHFGSLVKRAQRNQSELSLSEGRPLLNLDLKGPNLTMQHIINLEQIAKENDILQYVVICATALGSNDVGPGIDLLQLLGVKRNNSLKIGLVLRDRVDEDNDLERVFRLINQYSAVELIVPSNNFYVQYFHSLKSAQKPISSWTVDDEGGLMHAVESGLDAIISNHPIQLNSKLGSMKGSC